MPFIKIYNIDLYKSNKNIEIITKNKSGEKQIENANSEIAKQKCKDHNKKQTKQEINQICQQ